MKKLIWLDDDRSPFLNNWLRYSPIEEPYEVFWLKSYDEFVEYISKNGIPDAICFDHDLGNKIDPDADLMFYNGEISSFSLLSYDNDEKTGYDCAKWLVEYCLDNNLMIPLYSIQSMNSVGKKNIDDLLKNFIKNIKK